MFVITAVVVPVLQFAMMQHSAKGLPNGMLVDSHLLFVINLLNI